MSNIEFCGASGLRALLGLREKLCAQGGTVRLRLVHPGVAQVLQVAGVLDMFPVDG